MTRSYHTHLLVGFSALSLLAQAQTPAPTAAPAPVVTAAPADVDFSHVQAILETKCLECHNPNKVKGKLLMDTAEALLKGGESGPALVTSKPEESELI